MAEVKTEDAIVTSVEDLKRIINDFEHGLQYGYLEAKKGSHDWTQRFFILLPDKLVRYRWAKLVPNPPAPLLKMANLLQRILGRS